MAIAVKNKGRAPVVLTNLDERVEVPFLQTEHDRKSGVVAQRRVSLSLPTTVTLLPGEVRTGLPDSMAAEAKQYGCQVWLMPQDEATAPAEEPAPRKASRKRKGNDE